MIFSSQQKTNAFFLKFAAARNLVYRLLLSTFVTKTRNRLVFSLVWTVYGRIEERRGGPANCSAYLFALL